MGKTGRALVMIGMGFALAATLIFTLVPGKGGPDVLANNESEGASAPALATPDPGLQEALTALEKQVAADPSDVQSAALLGETYLKLGRYQEASDTYEKVLKLRSNGVDRAQLGLAYFFQGRQDDGMRELRQAVQESPKEAETHYWLAVMLTHSATPDVPTAVREWETTIKLAPGSDLAKKSEEYLARYKGQ